MKKLLLIFILFSCKKEQPTKIEESHCSNWAGTWWQFAGDTIMTDSLVISVDFYKDSEVYYKSNLFTGLHHSCPLNSKTDDLHIYDNGKNYYFRH